MKNCRNIIILVLLIVILLMSVAYSAFTTQLTVNGTAEIISEWNVKITGIRASFISEGCDAGDPQFTNSTVTFDAKLVKPGDHITYLITIENTGTFNATLSKATFTESENGSTAIIYKTEGPPDTLNAGSMTAFLVNVTFDENTTEMPESTEKSFTGVIEYVQSTD